MLQTKGESHVAEIAGSSARGQVRREAIIGAAAELFRRRGYPDVGIDDIGAVLELSGPALYRYFAGKPDLLKAVVHGYIEEQNVAWLQQDPDVLTAVVSAAVRNPNGFAVYASQHDYLDEAAWKEVAADRARIRHAWDEHMASIGVPRTGADGRLRVIAVQGMLLHACLSRRASRAVRISVAQDMGDRILRAPVPSSPPVDPVDVAMSPLLHVGKREAILAAAGKQFSQRGFAAVTLRDIGHDVGLTPSAVSRHFPSKESILSAAIDRAGHQTAAAIASSLKNCLTPEGAVREIIRRYCTLVVESSDIFNVNARLLGSLDPAKQKTGIQRRRQNVEELAAKIHDSVEGMTLPEARIRAGSVFSIANQVISQTDLLSRPALSAELANICTHAIGPAFNQ